ncbi:MAG: hypothetical protein AB7T86_04795 [Xanthobacteraceae bacterium]|uniref:hypothetical protein n=1 Tax=Pseudolabrys sp. TaxID=1960880 RepID=UPI003D12C7A8
MWAAFARQIAAYAITRRGKKLFALIGVLALCFGAALLIDMQLYLSAGFTAVLACFAAAAFVVQHAKIKRAELERLARKAEAARQRALAAQARIDRIDNAKAAFTGAFTGAAQSARTAFVDMTRETVAVASETVDAVSRGANAMAEAVNDAALRAANAMTEAVAGVTARTTTGAEHIARAGLVRVVKGWRTLRGDQGLAP